MPIKLLIAEDELNLSFVLQKELSRQGCTVCVVNNGDEAIKAAREEEFHVALLDLMMPGASGIQVLRSLVEQDPAPEVIIMTGHATVHTALEAMKFGAYDYLTKPCALEQITETIRKAYEKGKLKRENLVLQNLVKHHSPHPQSSRLTQHSIVTSNEKMMAVLARIDEAANDEIPVLIHGETGTGRELIARAIHNASSRRTKPFVSINCATTLDPLFEADLFGHEAGAFSAARGRKLGLLEMANQGTLYLEEINGLSLASQSKIINALETNSFYRLGGTRRVDTDVRIIASTSQDLAALEQQERFKPDLLNKINSTCISIPSLRQRPEDIVGISEHFLKSFAPNRSIIISMEAQQVLRTYPWPGNLRELRNVLERAILLSRSNVIQPSDLLVELASREALPFTPVVLSNHSQFVGGLDHGLGAVTSSFASNETAAKLEEIERREILSALNRTNWHQGKTADVLGISPSTLYRRLREYKITKRLVKAQRASV